MTTSTKARAAASKVDLAVSVTVAQFIDSSRFEVLREDVAIGDFTPLAYGEYSARGVDTPLRDATARFISILDDLQAEGRVAIGLLADASGSMSGNEESVTAGINEFVAGMAEVDAVDENAGGRVLCVILTDGLENWSREVSPEALRAMIAEREKRGWTFIYLGANQDAWSEGSRLGYSGGARGQTVNFAATPTGTASALRSVAGDARSYLADNSGYMAARASTSQRTISEDGEETSAPVAPTPRANHWGGQPGMGAVGKPERERTYGSVDDALKAAKDATRR